MLTDREREFGRRFGAERPKEREAHYPIGRIMGLVAARRGERVEIDTAIDLMRRPRHEVSVSLPIVLTFMGSRCPAPAGLL